MTELIIVIDDNQPILELYELLLTGEGYRVSLHSFWERNPGLDFIAQNQPALIITDLLMGKEFDGLRLIRQIQARPEINHIPIIICIAANAELSQIVLELEARKVTVVLKPFDIEELLKTVSAVTKAKAKAAIIPFQVEESK